MGTFGGAQPIVTDGLVFAVDAANYQSYPGSGTTWSDMVGGNDGTLVNGPTFDEANGGSLVFDGANDYVDFGLASDIRPSNEFTWVAWCYPQEKTSKYRTVFSTGYSSTTGVQLRMNRSLPTNNNEFIFETNHTLSGQQSVTTGTVDNDKWYMVSGVVDSSTRKIYLNTTLKNNNTVSGDYITGSNNLTIGDNRVATEYWLGNIGPILLYHKPLTPSEITQNYNALKSRFGLT